MRTGNIWWVRWVVDNSPEFALDIRHSPCIRVPICSVKIPPYHYAYEVRDISTPNRHVNGKVFKLRVWKTSKCSHVEVGKSTRCSFERPEVENDILFVDRSYTASYPYRKFKLRNGTRKSICLSSSGNMIVWLSPGLYSTLNRLFSEEKF